MSANARIRCRGLIAQVITFNEPLPEVGRDLGRRVPGGPELFHIRELVKRDFGGERIVAIRVVGTEFFLNDVLRRPLDAGSNRQRIGAAPPLQVPGLRRPWEPLRRGVISEAVPDLLGKPTVPKNHNCWIK